MPSIYFHSARNVGPLTVANAKLGRVTVIGGMDHPMNLVKSQRRAAKGTSRAAL